MNQHFKWATSQVNQTVAGKHQSADQLAHLGILISAFLIRYLDSIIAEIATLKIFLASLSS